jgi:8-oxo-dGTP pyrophosphatase MutT (NUDIX family)
MKKQHKAKLAATVILLRPAAANGFEVFLTRRPNEMAFLGGMYCFPGGGLHKGDYSAAMLRRSHGLSPIDARKIVGAQFSPPQALGLWIAAMRELFEEAGILFAVNHFGKPWVAEPGGENNLADKHAAVLKNTLSFESLLESEDLLCDTHSLTYFSHWQTPQEVSIRFDTRVFLAVLPENQTPLATTAEVAHSLWLTPDRALNLFAEGELPMIFPTFASLRTLADFELLESVLKEYQPDFNAAAKQPPR